MTEKNDNMIKEIELIQKCIDRMSNASFIIKGWSITLFTITLTLFSGKTNNVMLFLICAISISCFWYMDACFLKTEKLYRLKYEWVIINRKDSDDYQFDLDPHNKQMRPRDENGTIKNSSNTFQLMFSRTIWPIYLPMIMVNGIFCFISFA